MPEEREVCLIFVWLLCIDRKVSLTNSDTCTLFVRRVVKRKPEERKGIARNGSERSVSILDMEYVKISITRQEIG